MDDILGLYNERSRSRGGASSLGRSQLHELETSSSHVEGMALNLVEEDGDSPTMFGLGIVVFQTIVTEESWVICDQRAL